MKLKLKNTDGGYGRELIISVEIGKCDVCGDDNVAVITHDGSEGEYWNGSICRPCSEFAFGMFLDGVA